MMYTNVLGVMRTVERLHDPDVPAGTIAVMSSGQGSVSGNTAGGFEVYRATESASAKCSDATRRGTATGGAPCCGRRDG